MTELSLAQLSECDFDRNFLLFSLCHFLNDENIETACKQLLAENAETRQYAQGFFNGTRTVTIYADENTSVQH